MNIISRQRQTSLSENEHLILLWPTDYDQKPTCDYFKESLFRIASNTLLFFFFSENLNARVQEPKNI